MVLTSQNGNKPNKEVNSKKNSSCIKHFIYVYFKKHIICPTIMTDNTFSVDMEIRIDRLNTHASYV